LRIENVEISAKHACTLRCFGFQSLVSSSFGVLDTLEVEIELNISLAKSYHHKARLEDPPSKFQLTSHLPSIQLKRHAQQVSLQNYLRDIQQNHLVWESRGESFLPPPSSLLRATQISARDSYYYTDSAPSNIEVAKF